jgi:uncharacterized protein
MPAADSIQEKFTRALEDLAEQVKRDRSVLAAVLCGSLSHDTVWAKSDIDLVFVTVDDKKVPTGSHALNANGVNVHAFLMPRTQFRQTVEGSLRNSFMHSFLAKGRLLYTHDESIAALFAKLGEMGERDTQLQLLRAAIGALGPIDKAHKWMLTRGDLDYTALWILYSATALARIEVLSARQLAGREVILQAMKLNPKFFKTIYTDMLNVKKTKKSVQAALDTIDRYLIDRAESLFHLVLDHLQEVGEARSATEIETYFQRNFDIEGVTGACEYLADRGMIAKVSTPVQLTRMSNIQVQELAFAYIGGLDGNSY